MQEQSRKRRRQIPDIIALAALLLGITLFHWRGVRPGYTFLPVDLSEMIAPWNILPENGLQNATITDPLYQYLPFNAAAAHQWQREKQWPLWNPSVFLGHPILADPLSQPFYPLIPWLARWVGVGRAFTLGLWGQVSLGACLAYGWLRIWDHSPLAALAGGWTFALSGTLVIWFETTFWVSTIIWLPGIWLFFDLALKRQNPALLAPAAAAVALALLGGQIQFTIIFLLFTGALVVARIWLDSPERGSGRWRPLAYFLAMGLPGGMTAGIFILPFLELTRLSHRFSASRVPLGDELPWPQLVTLIVPDYFGNPTSTAYRGLMANYSEGTVYVGVVALFLSGLILFQKNKVHVNIFLLTLGLIFYFILGGPGVPQLGLVPGFGLLTLHRSIFLLPLFFAWLTAYAIDHLEVKRQVILGVGTGFILMVVLAAYLGREHWPVFGGSVFIALLWIALTAAILLRRVTHPIESRWLDVGLVVLIFLDLTTWGFDYNPAGEIKKLMTATPGIITLQQQLNSSTNRLMVLQRHNNVLFGLGNGAAYFDLPSAGGNSSLVFDRYLALTARDDPTIDVPWAQKGNIIAFSYPSDRLIDLLGITHLTAATRLNYPDIYVEQEITSCENGLYLTPDLPEVRGQFTPRRSAINRLDIRVSGTADLQGARLLVKLWPIHNPDNPVLEQESTLSPGREAQTQTFFFAPEIRAPGTTYLWSAVLVSGDEAVLCAAADGSAAVSIYGTTWQPLYEGEFFAYERLPAVSRAYVAYQVETIADDNQAVSRLLDPSFNPGEVVLVPDSIPLDQSLRRPVTPAKITRYTSREVVIEPQAEASGVLVLRDQHHPGWKVYVDGEPARMIRVNHIFRGVVVDAATQEVVFPFQPLSLAVGRILSGAGVISILGLIGFGWWSRPPKTATVIPADGDSHVRFYESG